MKNQNDLRNLNTLLRRMTYQDLELSFKESKSEGHQHFQYATVWNMN